MINIYFTCPAHAQKFQFEGEKNRETIKFIQIKNLIIIPVFINGKGPYNFLLDTGVGQMIITDTTFIKDLNLKNAKVFKIQGYGLGEGIEAALTRNITAAVGKATIKNIPTAVFKTDIFDLSSYLGIRIDGILGYYFFNSFVVRVNYSSNEITYYNHEANIKRKGVRLPIKIINAKPYIDARISIKDTIDTTVQLLVDNGSSHPLMMESLKNMAFPLPKTTIPANLGVGINGEIKGSMGRVDLLKIRDFSFRQILSGFPDFSVQRTEQAETSRNGTLGAEVLKHFLVTFDYKNEALYLKKKGSFKGKSDHDMSGMEIYIDHDILLDGKNPVDRYYIGRIEPGSPAEEIGITAGDQINSIDFRSMRTFTLNELTELLRERDGKQLVIEIERKTKRFFVVLTLKRRI